MAQTVILVSEIISNEEVIIVGNKMMYKSQPIFDDNLDIPTRGYVDAAIAAGGGGGGSGDGIDNQDAAPQIDAKFWIDGKGQSRKYALRALAEDEGGIKGPELLTDTGWVLGAGWTGDFATGFTHAAGNTAALTNPFTPTAGTYYVYTITISGRTAGSIMPMLGSMAVSGIQNNGVNDVGMKTSNTAAVSINPTSDFDGTILISLKLISANPDGGFQIINSAGDSAVEMRSLGDRSSMALGYLSGSKFGASLTPTYNTFVGYQAGVNFIGGIGNTFVGANAGRDAFAGEYNVIIGYNAAPANIKGLNSVYIGANTAAVNGFGSANVFVGSGTGAASTGGGCVYIGYNAGLINTSGSNNVMIGNTAGAGSTNGSYNVIIGHGAGSGNYTQGNGVLIGYDAGKNCAGAYQTICIGAQAGLTATVAGVFIGPQAAQSVTGNYNVFIGSQAGRYVQAGAYNIGIGEQSLSHGSDAQFNICIGNYSGRNNQWDKFIQIGANANPSDGFVEDPATTKGFTEANISGNNITITAHGFGATNKHILLKYKLVSGSLGGMVNNNVYRFKVIDANTVQFLDSNISSASGSFSLTKDMSRQNSIGLGYGAVPSKANQTVIGDGNMAEVSSPTSVFVGKNWQTSESSLSGTNIDMTLQGVRWVATNTANWTFNVINATGAGAREIKVLITVVVTPVTIGVTGAIWLGPAPSPIPVGKVGLLTVMQINNVLYAYLDVQL